jgi:lipopolysaccharide transport system permease protein
MLKALWAYRHFVLSAIKSELKGRFARSRLGALWFILHPLAHAAVLALVLAEVLSARLPEAPSKAAYALYLLAGTTAWALFSEIVSRCTGIFIEYSSVLRKIAFPRICLPVIVGGSALLHHALVLLAIVTVFLLLGVVPSGAIGMVALGAVLIAAFGFGLGVMLGILNVFTRDVAQVLGIVLQFWFWLTPIVYTREMLPPHLRGFIDLNPLYPMVRIYQDALVWNRLPEGYALVWPAALALALLIGSLLLFRRASADLVDAL